MDEPTKDEGKPDVAKILVQMTPAQHKQLKLWAIENEMSMAAVVRVALRKMGVISR